MGYDNTNRGVLFKNERKEKETQSDYSGSVDVDGVEYFFNGWVKTAGANAKNPGAKFLSVSVKKKEEQAVRPTTLPTFDDDIMPF